MQELENYQSDDPMIGKIKGLMGFKDGGKISSTFNNLRQGKAFDTLVGMSPQEISNLVADGKSPVNTGREDLQTHALTSKLLADRMGGSFVPRLLGLGNEVAGGLVSLASGGGFTGETGFDLEDLLANEVGFQDRNKPKKLIKPQKKAHGGQVLPTKKGSVDKFQAQRQAVGPVNPAFTNEDLDKIDATSSNPLQLSTRSQDLDSLKLQHANETRRAALYSALMSTAGEAPKAKLGVLLQNSQVELERLGQSIALHGQEDVQREQIAAGERATIAQLDANKTQQDFMNQMRLDDQALRQAIAGAQNPGLNDQSSNESLPEGQFALGNAQGQFARSQATLPPAGNAQGQGAGTNAVAQSAGSTFGGLSVLGALSESAVRSRGTSADTPADRSIEGAFGFSPGDVPGINPQEIARNASLMQNPRTLLQLWQASPVTPGMINQAAKFLEMFKSLPPNSIDPDTFMSLQQLGNLLANTNTNKG
jgi:hypothetical protein